MVDNRYVVDLSKFIYMNFDFCCYYW